MKNVEAFLFRRWNFVFDESPESARVRDMVLGMYKKNALPYHNPLHLFTCFAVIDMASGLLTRHVEVQAALFYHDAVYDPERKDNEEKSALLAEETLGALRVEGSPIDVARVASLIRATTHTVSPEDDDMALLLDVDLYILGAKKPRYHRYARAIRREYGWVPDDAYREGRTKVLKHFLARPHVYHTALFQERLDAVARSNMQSELRLLSM